MRTSLSEWQMPRGQSGAQIRYVEIQEPSSDTVNAFQSRRIRIPFPDGISGVSMKTIRITSERDIQFRVKIIDDDTEDVIYKTREVKGLHYDLVDIPYLPKENKEILLDISNRGNIATKFSINIRGIEVT